MLFNSYEFLIFLPVVLVIYYVLNKRAQNIWLLLCSYFFYGWWDWRFTSLLLISTVLDFNCARQMEHRPQKVHFFLLASLCGNLGILGTFKYFNFFMDSTIRVFNSLHLHPHIPMLRVVLPVGISFYTFQTLAYTIDVYRGKLKPTQDFVDFALYVAFFPQLVAGPIERATNLLPQMQKKRMVNEQMLTTGLFLILIGYVKKVGIADAIAPYVEGAFANPSRWSSAHLLSAVYLFSFQIYCDFSGYSDIARGVGRLLGVKIMENFNQPYFSTNVTEFWRRWHISLSSWLKDYLYIPLGGNRHGKAKTYRNLMLTMVLGGLWHGAKWTFVVWGTLHGMYLVIHKLILGDRRVSMVQRFQSPADYVRFIMKSLFTFHLVTLTWVFFRSADFTHAFEYLKGILVWHGSLMGIGDLVRVGFYGALIGFIDWTQYRRGSHVALLERHWAIRGAVYASFLFVIILGRTYDNVPFIYFQF